MEEKNHTLFFDGSNFFFQRLVLSVLSRTPVVIRSIRMNEEAPGLKDYETALLNLLQDVSNGSKFHINKTGTLVKFFPGMLDGGEVTLQCPTSRSIGYYLMALMMVAPFCKTPINATLTGITNLEGDPSVDKIKSAVLPVLQKFITDASECFIKIQDNKRGFPPKGGGVVVFKCPVVRTLKPFQWKNCGKVQKIRGTAFTSRTAPNISNRMIDSAKSVFNNFLSDVYFDMVNKKCESPGYGMNFHAITNAGCHYTAEYCYEARSDQTSLNAEDIGKEGANRLLKEIYNGGSVSAVAQPLIFLFMVLNSRDISQVVTGALTPYSSRFLRHLRDFFGITFKIEEYEAPSIDGKPLKTGGPKLLLTCVGAGFSNMNKSVI